MSYFKSEAEDKPIALGIILGVVLPIIGIIAILAICIIKRQRKNGPSKDGIPDMLKDYDAKVEEEEIGMNHVSVKADMNGHIPGTGNVWHLLHLNISSPESKVPSVHVLFNPPPLQTALVQSKTMNG